MHLVARGAQLEAIQRDGVRVLSARGDFVAHPPATSDPAEIGVVDIVFLGLKAHSYATPGRCSAPLDEHTGVVAAQNGIPWWYFHGLDGPYPATGSRRSTPAVPPAARSPPDRAIGCVVYSPPRSRLPV